MITIGEVESSGRRAIESLLADGTLRSARYHAECDSTNTLALEDLRSGAIEPDQLPRLYLADRQTAGRGRHGRSWHSDRGTLTLSIVIEWQFDGTTKSKLLSLAVGVGVARAIEYLFAPMQTRLKWPNDVYIDAGKVAGILIETNQSTANRVVLGIGVNVSAAPELADPQSPPIRSLAQVSGRPADRYEVLESLATEIIAAATGLRDNPTEILREFRNRCMLTGQQVTYRQGEQQREGRCAGVTESGGLWIERGAGGEEIQSGEAQLVRPTKGH